MPFSVMSLIFVFEEFTYFLEGPAGFSSCPEVGGSSYQRNGR
jgi:hypothetical protein